jgi:Ni,Fe-hydrogenase III small subunit
MNQWVIKGLKTGIKTTQYPRIPELAPGISPGLPAATRVAAPAAASLVARCPTGALGIAPEGLSVDRRRCVHCFRCAPGADDSLDWELSYEWGRLSQNDDNQDRRLGRPFRRSAHILVVDAGDCGACLNEVRQLNNPYYNMHRLGFFLTPTPRHADILLVVGAGTVQMRHALGKAYEAMPTPKRVVAVGACALFGGVFGPSFACGAGVGDVVPVDVEVPGNPPPPLAILHGLLVAVGQRPPASEVG